MRVSYRLLMRKLSDFFGRWPPVYVALMRWRLRGKQSVNKVISRESAIVIEGFPRCANSFAVKAFRMSNDPGRKVLVATHLHSPAHVLMGLKYRIPTLVVIRNPDDAIPSLLALSMQLGKFNKSQFSDKEQRALITYWTQFYSRFYDCLMPHLDDLVIADFTETTKDFNQVLMRLNAKYSVAFKSFEHTPEAVKEIFDSAKVHLSPSEDRDTLKRDFKDAYFSDFNERNRDRAQATYHRVLNERSG